MTTPPAADGLHNYWYIAATERAVRKSRRQSGCSAATMPFSIRAEDVMPPCSTAARTETCRFPSAR